MSKIIKIEVLYDIGDIVYINTDENQAKYVVMAYSVRLNEVIYELYNHGNGDYTAYDFEISLERLLQI